jgi:type I restriction enzyme S subunit
MISWRSANLAEVLTLQRGHDLPSQNRKPGKVPIIGSFGITGFHDAPKYKGPGVAIGRSGASIGVATYCKLDYWPLNTCLFVTDFRGNDPRWIYYLLESIDFAGYNSGSAQPSLNRNYLTNIQVPLPPLAEQRAIAEVLGALDDKIESNRRAVHLLDEIMESEYGASSNNIGISANEVLTPILGGTPRRNEDTYWNGGIPWASAKDVTANEGSVILRTVETITIEGVANSAAKVLPAGATVLTARGTVGAMARLGSPMSFNQTCYGLLPNEGVDPLEVYWSMRQAVGELKRMSHGTVFDTITKATFTSLQLRLPHPEIRKKLCDRFRTFDGSLQNFLRESEKLSELRDTVLPELLSGRLRTYKAFELVEAL